LKVFQSTLERPVYINGLYCKSLSDAARVASGMLGINIPLWKIQRAISGTIKINGIEIREEREIKQYVEKKHIKGTPLLYFPLGEGPLERGIYHWR